VSRLPFAVTTALLVSLEVAAQTRGGIAFHYATPLTARDLAFYGHFDVLVTHDPLPRAQVDALHASGTRVVLYEWAVAFYASLRTPWQASLPASALLNATPLRGHLGAADADAYYYDPASREHQRDRAEALARRLQAIGYDGVFLDTTTFRSVHPEAFAEFKRRHPGADYDEAFATFLASLRREVRVIVTNQGYRSAEAVLPYVDWEVSESLITHPTKHGFALRPWNDAKDSWNSIAFLMRHVIEPVRRRYPQVRFAHINYVDDAKHIDTIVAIGCLFDTGVVVAQREVAATIESPLLLLDFGAPLRGTDTHRFFERGFVAYNPRAKAVRIANHTEYVDAVTGAQVRGTIVVPPHAARILRTP
jgi:hypothetical protein